MLIPSQFVYPFIIVTVNVSPLYVEPPKNNLCVASYWMSNFMFVFLCIYTFLLLKMINSVTKLYALHHLPMLHVQCNISHWCWYLDSLLLCSLQVRQTKTCGEGLGVCCNFIAVYCFITAFWLFCKWFNC